jgi:pyrroline-5-carboxylate reductase
MTEALVGGLINSKTSSKDMITSSNPSPPRREYMTEKFGIETFQDNIEIVKRNEIIVLSVKPYTLETVLNQIKYELTPEHLIVSVAAGKTIGWMQNILGEEARIVRTMVNTPALVGEMAGAYSMGE